MTTFAQRLTDPSAAPNTSADLVNLSNLAGRELVKHINASYSKHGENGHVYEPSDPLWRKHPYFSLPSAESRLADPRDTRFGLELGAYTHEATRALRRSGYDVSPAYAVQLQESLVASNGLTPLVRLTQDVAALSQFLKECPIPSEARPRYEAVLEIRAAQLAQMQHYRPLNPAEQQSAVATAHAILVSHAQGAQR